MNSNSASPESATQDALSREGTSRERTPREIVAELDRYIVGQNAAKRAVAIAVRNRWRRQQLPAELRREIAPKNILMIGPTGVGKTEIARRLARLTGAPFIKVEATKYTEVGYYGRDVESMVRELVENAIGIVRAQERVKVEATAKEQVLERLIDLLAKVNDDDDAFEPDDELIQAFADREDDDLFDEEELQEEFGISSLEARALNENMDDDELDAILNDEQAEEYERNTAHLPPDDRGDASRKEVAARETPGHGSGDPSYGGPGPAADAGSTPLPEWVREADQEAAEREAARDAIRAKLLAGQLEQEFVELRIEQKPTPVMMGGMGFDHMDVDFQGMIEKIIPKHNLRRRVTVAEARQILFEQECDALLDPEKINAAAIELAENLGIVFLDEIDKVVASEGKGADVSRQGVQRDLLPIVEGTTINTRYGYVRTDHVLFVAAGAFHKHKPSDLMPELQGRFPIRVELQELTKQDFIRILTEPQNSLTSQYAALLGAEGLELEFTPDAVDALATFAFQVNQSTQNIGARRLYTILERLLEELSFEAPDRAKGKVVIDAAYVSQRLKTVAEDEDLSKFIL